MNNFYSRLAFTNMRNNKQFYLPYLFTSILSVMLYYCVNALRMNDGLKTVRGAGDVLMFMSMGTIIITVFITILLFYTNSFIIKRRKKELGVYNILGMEKKHLAKVLFWESLVSLVAAVALGLILGITFQKYFSMILYKITGIDESVPFYISGESCKYTLFLFCAIYFLNYLYNVIQIKLAKPVELLHASNAGEKEPKTKILMTIIGIACVGIGYYIALTTTDPVAAIFYFFLAVLLVIIGTYLLFTAGSIALLKLLKKNKNYYYQTKHFTSVSGMFYRMKQNAVGLANICILSTMVLVVLSSTTSMYLGLNDLVDTMIDTDVSVRVDVYGIPGVEMTEQLRNEVGKSIASTDIDVTKAETFLDFSFVGMINETDFIYSASLSERVDYSDEVFLQVMTARQYKEKYNVEAIELDKNQVCFYSTFPYENATINIHGLSYDVVETGELDLDEGLSVSKILQGTAVMVVSDETVMEEIYNVLDEIHIPTSIIPSPFATLYLKYDFDGTKAEKGEVVDAINSGVANWQVDSDLSWCHVNTESRIGIYEDYMMMHGGIFFLGLFLGTMFLMITVLIIYYKQISEGYEDRERFKIMQKVGMSNKEVKDTIQSQVRTVFFLPLVTANIHLLAAFPMLMKILNLMFISNITIFIECLIGTVIIFAIIYYVVFKITSRTYVKIVGNQI